MKNFSIKRIIAGILLTIMVMTSLDFMPLEVKAASSEWNFSYTGNVQEWTAPKTGKYKITVTGANGGGVNQGPQGATIQGYIDANIGETYYIAVGGNGSASLYGAEGGWNGGGASRGYGGSGGGATSIYNKLIGDGQLVNYKNSKEK